MGNALPFIIFTFSMLFSPGPNNMMLMATGVNFGIRKGLSHSMGVCIGFSVMTVLVGVGFGFIFDKFPFIQTIICIVGLAYILYLAWLIAGRPFLSKKKIDLKIDLNSKEKVSDENPPRKNRITFWKAVLFQWINPKAWITISVAIASYSSSTAEHPLTIPVIIMIFFCVALASSHMWLIFGSLLQRFLNAPRRKRIFNYVMAGLLVLSIIPVIYEMVVLILLS